MDAHQLIRNKSIIGMIHCLPLPGTMGFCGNMQTVIDRALQDLEVLERAGVDGVIVENFCDNPPSTKLEPEQLAALAAVSMQVMLHSNILVGIDAAFSDPIASLAIAKAVGASFIRVPVFVDTVVTSDGVVSPCARELQRYRKLLSAEDILLLCDIQAKHTFMLAPAISIEESARMADACGADALIITGSHTGSSSSMETFRTVQRVTSLPLIAGSGICAENLEEQFSCAGAAIVGSALKQNGRSEEPVDYSLAHNLMKCARKLRAEA